MFIMLLIRHAMIFFRRCFATADADATLMLTPLAAAAAMPLERR